MTASRIRVIDLETTGSRPPAHDVCEIGWQDVVLGADGTWAVNEERGSVFVDPGRPIPPVTMAVHHIWIPTSPAQAIGATWRRKFFGPKAG